MKIDSDPLQIAEARYTEPKEVNFIETADDFCMTEVTEDFVHELVMVKIHEHFEQAPHDGLALRGTKDIKKENVEASDIEDARESKIVMITKETADTFVQMTRLLTTFKNNSKSWLLLRISTWKLIWWRYL